AADGAGADGLLSTASASLPSVVSASITDSPSARSGRCETGEGGGWGHGWARAGGAGVDDVRRPSTAPRKPCFPCFKVYYLPQPCVLAKSRPLALDIESRCLDGVRKTQRHWPAPLEYEDWGRPPCAGKMDSFLRYGLALATNLNIPI
ncbi:hypothetical protein THAOC_17852, partial [Thalassiosira oceanica]